MLARLAKVALALPLLPGCGDSGGGDGGSETTAGEETTQATSTTMPPTTSDTSVDGSTSATTTDDTTGGSTSSATEGSTGEPTDAVVEVCTGGTHSCARNGLGEVRCWGDATNGQLGLGNVDDLGDDETPDSVPAIDLGGSAEQIACGDQHVCAIVTGGAVRCWGLGGFGRLGYANEDAVGDDETPAAAGDVDVGGVAVQIDAGTDHTCALLEGGAVRCWGRGDGGRLGYGVFGDVGDDELPADAGDVDVGGTVVQISAGYQHTCALLEGGAVRCWGFGTDGRLGYGNTTTIGDDEVPSSAGDVDVGAEVEHVSAGYTHTCALLVGGDVRCWGASMTGALGYGNATSIGDDEPASAAGVVDVGGEVALLDAGRGTCSVLVDGAVRCWGGNQFGTLGLGHTMTIGDDEAPSTAGDAPIGAAAGSISAASYHACIVTSVGDARCWGAGGQGQLGQGATANIGDDETPDTVGPVPLW